NIFARAVPDRRRLWPLARRSIRARMSRSRYSVPRGACVQTPRWREPDSSLAVPPRGHHDSRPLRSTLWQGDRGFRSLRNDRDQQTEFDVLHPTRSLPELMREYAQLRVIEAPPSTNEAVPVTKEESSEARYSTERASSSGCASRFSAWRLVIHACLSA